jgi:transglutaminase-like putative cysteine protease
MQIVPSSGIPAYSIRRTATNPHDNFTSTADTIDQMIVLVQENVNSPYIQSALQSIKGNLGRQTRPGVTPTTLDLARAIWWYVKSKIRFVTDEETLIRVLQLYPDYNSLGTGKELLLSPSFVLQMKDPIGDCDDFSMLIATLLIAAGVQGVYFCTVAGDRNDPDAFTHVYVNVELYNGTMFPLDASHGNYPGWETKSIFKGANWSVDGQGKQVTIDTNSTNTITDSDSTKSNVSSIAENLVTGQIIQHLPFAQAIYSELSANPLLAAIGL